MAVAKVSDDAKNAMLNALDEAVMGYMSLHSSDPGDNATSAANSEISGGSPAYARQAIVWNAAATGSKAMSGTEVFNIPAGTTVAYIGLWSALTNGTFYISAPIDSRYYTNQGTLEITAATLTIPD